MHFCPLVRKGKIISEASLLVSASAQPSCATNDHMVLESLGGHMSWPSHGASQVWCPDETDVWTVFEASNVQKSSQGIKSTWGSIKVFWFLVLATENPVLRSAPDPSNCC